MIAVSALVAVLLSAAIVVVVVRSDSSSQLVHLTVVVQDGSGLADSPSAYLASADPQRLLGRTSRAVVPVPGDITDTTVLDAPLAAGTYSVHAEQRDCGMGSGCPEGYRRLSSRGVVVWRCSVEVVLLDQPVRVTVTDRPDTDDTSDRDCTADELGGP